MSTVVITEELRDEYYLALGKFMFAFARAETDLTATAINYANETIMPTSSGAYPVLRALIYAGSFDAAKKTLQRLLRVRKAPPKMKQAVDAILNQFDLINRLRNLLVHVGANPSLENDEGWFVVGNTISVQELDKMELVYFKAQTLLDAAYDLKLIPEQLAFEMMTPVREVLNRPEYKVARARLKEQYRYSEKQLRRTGPKHGKTSGGKSRAVDRSKD